LVFFGEVVGEAAGSEPKAVAVNQPNGAPNCSFVTSDDFAPMEMRSVEELPSETGWQFEPKWDGFRCIAHRDGSEVRLRSKSGQPLARYFPEIVEALLRVTADRFSLDGELVVRESGVPAFGVLQQRIHPAASRVNMLARATPAEYLVFDLLREDGVDLVAETLERRRPALERFISLHASSIPEIVLSPATLSVDRAKAWFDDAGGGLDGVIAKKLGVPYAAGRRDAAVKVKQLRTADCVIGGFRYAKASEAQVGSLLLGLFDGDGLLDYVGFCSAFSIEEKRLLVDRLRPHLGEPGFTGSAPDAAPSRWTRDPQADRTYVKLRHELVLEVSFDQVTGQRMRHGTRPLRWRVDEDPRTCTLDQILRPQQRQ
jgi:ATP-dependent DNA ligase